VKLAVVAAALGLAACGDDGSMATDPDAAVEPDAAGCSKPALDAAWLPQFLPAVMKTIPGPRATTTQRTQARTFLKNQLTQIGWTPTEHTYNSGANVVVDIPATTSDTKALIVGAHFDTVSGSPGSNDNAGGTVVVLALAKYLREVPCRAHPVKLVLFDEEEVALVGARAYANTLSAANVLAVHTVDQVSYDSDSDHKFEIESPTAALEAEYQAAAAVVGVPVAKTLTMGTDHEAFRDVGLPAVGLTEEYVGGDTSPYRHTAQDVESTTNYAYLTLATKLVAQVIMSKL